MPCWTVPVWKLCCLRCSKSQDNLWEAPPWYDDIRALAKAEGLWNLSLHHEYEPWSPGLTNVEIASLFETMSKVIWAHAAGSCW